jgi:hypothetical protein
MAAVMRSMSKMQAGAKLLQLGLMGLKRKLSIGDAGMFKIRCTPIVLVTFSDIVDGSTH